MREILFRGKRVDNGEWIYGDLRHWPSGNVGIHSEELHHTYYVDPESVGQFTGLVDVNGKKIFERHLVMATLEATAAQPEFSWGACEVVFQHCCFGLKTDRDFIPFSSFSPRVAFEVVANIFTKEDEQ